MNQAKSSQYEWLYTYIKVIRLGGSDNEEEDLLPAAGQVEFANGESLKKLHLTIKDDQVDAQQFPLFHM